MGSSVVLPEKLAVQLYVDDEDYRPVGCVSWEKRKPLSGANMKGCRCMLVVELPF
jgi:hypothetical protein